MTLPVDAIEVLPPDGFIRVLGIMGSDLDIVNAARVSFAKASMEYGDTEDGILRYLLVNHHGTPFEHTFLRVHVKAPIFVMREWHRHRIGVSINEASARYTELEETFYYPVAALWRQQVGRPGAYRYEQITDPDVIADCSLLMRHAYGRAYATYLNLLERGVAKELARTVLPVGIYSEMHWTCNVRSLMAFLTLRNAPSAQAEIRAYAVALEQVFAAHFPRTHTHYIEAGRAAP